MALQTQANIQTQTPLPLGQAIRELPGQYIKVLTRPSVRTFEEEKGKASWSINWIQLIGLGIIGAVLQSLGLLISPPALGNMASTAGMSSSALLTTIIVFLAILEVILTPVSFLAAGGILFIIARAFGGKGTFKEQIYTTLLFGVPLVIASYLLFLIPIAGVWLLYLPHVYSIVLLIISFRAVHRFGMQKV
ncbi:MAG: Yip1 family protein [Ktedonobacteraceae bacterium]